MCCVCVNIYVVNRILLLLVYGSSFNKEGVSKVPLNLVLRITRVSFEVLNFQVCYIYLVKISENKKDTL